MIDGRETNWEELLATVSPETLAAAEAKTEAMLASLRLGALRKARGLTQQEMADRLDIRQVSVSKLEARTDVRVSTLRAVVEAMGGALEVRAKFADAEYRLDLGDDPDHAHVERVLAPRPTVEFPQPPSTRRAAPATRRSGLAADWQEWPHHVRVDAGGEKTLDLVAN